MKRSALVSRRWPIWTIPLFVLTLLIVSTLACTKSEGISQVGMPTPSPALTGAIPTTPDVTDTVPEACEGRACGPAGFIHADGIELRDGQGNPIKLRGVNLGGWLQWEGWIWGGGFTAESVILSRLQGLVGPQEAARFEAEIYRGFVAEQDIARIAELGFNVVRVPINHRLLEDDDAPFVYKESGWEVLDRLLAWCESNGVYVVITLHSAPGGQSRLFTADPQQRNLLWQSNENQERTVALWQAIAERYRHRTIVAGYDLLNEPDPTSGEELIAFYQRIIDVVRAVDPEHLILLEGSNFAQDFSMFSAPLTYNQAYSFHMYSWFGDDRAEKLAAYSALARQHNVPLWNGEFGENTIEIIESTVALYEDPVYAIQGWAFWTWKKVPNRFPALISIPVIDAWSAVIEWIELPLWPNEEPSAESAIQGINDFLANMTLDQNEENAEMIQILTGWQHQE